MKILRISVFGRFHVTHGQQVLAGLEVRKVQELFCYLLLNQERPHSRETLAGLLWGDHSTVQSKKYLRQTLWQLQAALDSQTDLAKNSVLLVEPDWVQINPEAKFWLDAAVLEEAFSLVQGRPGHEWDDQSALVAKRAIELYQGDLLEGWYQDWCLYERERLQNIYLTMLEKLIEYCERHQDYEAGIVYGMYILRCDRARERTHRHLMRLYYLIGNRTAALRQYERCVITLEEELGVGPAKLTETLYKQIQADCLDDLCQTPTAAGSNPEPKATVHSFRATLDYLKQIQAFLMNVHHQVEQEIQAVEQILNRQR